MAKMKPIHVNVSDKQLRDIMKLSAKLHLDRSALIRLAIARLVEEEAHRKPTRATAD